MATREKVILEAEDRASREFDKATGSFERMSGKMKKLALGGLAIGATALATLGTKVTGLAIDAAEAESAFNTAFGNALPRASAFVDEFASKAGFARHELQQMLAVTGTVIQGIGATEEESAALAERMAVLAGDVASFSNAAGGAESVLAALQSAINGEREALKTYGLALSETEVQERALIESGKDHADELTRLEKAQATVTLAYEKANKAVGDLDRTQDSAANTLRRLQGRFRDLGADVGALILPTVEEALPAIEAAVTSLAEGIAEIDIGALTRNFRLFFASLGRFSELGPFSVFNDAEMKALRDFFGAVRNGGDDVTALDKNLRRLTEENLNTSEMREIADKLIDLSGVDPVGLLSIADGLQPLGPFLQQINPEVDTLVTSLREAARGDLSGGLAMIPPPLDEIGQAARRAAEATGNLPLVVNEAGQALLDLIPSAEEASSALRDDLAEEAEGFITGFEKLPDRLKVTLKQFDKNLTDRIAAQEEFWTNLTTLAGAGLGNLAEAIRQQGPEAAGLLSEAVADMEEAARLDDLLAQANEQMGAVTDEYATALEQHADPTLTALSQFGLDMSDRIAEGIESGQLGRRLADYIRGQVSAVVGRPIPGIGAGLPPQPTGTGPQFQEGTWSVPGRGPVPAVVHGQETIFGPPGTSGRAAMVRELATELGRTLDGNNNRPSVTVEQITVLVPAGASMTETLSAAAAEAAIEAALS